MADDSQLRYELAQALDADKPSEAVIELRRLSDGTPHSSDSDVRRLAAPTLRRWGAAP
jgi:hypothetical protein